MVPLVAALEDAEHMAKTKAINKEGLAFYEAAFRERGLEFVPSHANFVLVKVGDILLPGQPIALVGSTGRSTGPHLHFQVSRDGRLQDPQQWLAGLDANASARALRSSVRPALPLIFCTAAWRIMAGTLATVAVALCFKSRPKSADRAL